MVSTLHEDAQRVISLLDAGGTLDDVDHSIDGMPSLGEDDRAALWLLAWSHRDRGRGTDTRLIELVSE